MGEGSGQDTEGADTVGGAANDDITEITAPPVHRRYSIDPNNISTWRKGAARAGVMATGLKNVDRIYARGAEGLQRLLETCRILRETDADAKRKMRKSCRG